MPRPEKTVIDWVIKSNSGKLERWQLDLMKNLKLQMLIDTSEHDLLGSKNEAITHI